MEVGSFQEEEKKERQAGRGQEGNEHSSTLYTRGRGIYNNPTHIHLPPMHCYTQPSHTNTQQRCTHKHIQCKHRIPPHVMMTDLKAAVGISKSGISLH